MCMDDPLAKSPQSLDNSVLCHVTFSLVERLLRRPGRLSPCYHCVYLISIKFMAVSRFVYNTSNAEKSRYNLDSTLMEHSK